MYYTSFCILQIPVLVCIAIISAYHCGKRDIYCAHYVGHNCAISSRIIITVCLVILPIIRAYIILSNTTPIPPKNVSSGSNSSHGSVTTSSANPETFFDTSNVIHQIKDEWNHSIDIAKSIFYPRTITESETESLISANTEDYAPVINAVKDNVTSAKPIDYLVAGTEGLAWVVHLCFILSLRKGRYFNPRGPVLVRALIFLLIVISTLLLRSHVKHNSENDVLPNLSLGFSISVVALLILYAITLIPGHNSLQDMRSSQFNEVSYYILLAFNIVVYGIISDYCFLLAYQYKIQTSVTKLAMISKTMD